MSYEGRTFIVGGAQSEWFAAGGGSGGGGVCVYSGGGSSVDGDSILTAQQPKAVEGVEGNRWRLWEEEGSRGKHCSLCVISNIR